MTLALNNLQSVDMPLNKETKPNVVRKRKLFPAPGRNLLIFFRSPYPVRSVLYVFTQAMRYNVIFLVEYNRFEFRVFLLLDWLPYQDEKSQFALLFSLRENSALVLWEM